MKNSLLLSLLLITSCGLFIGNIFATQNTASATTVTDNQPTIEHCSLFKSDQFFNNPEQHVKCILNSTEINNIVKSMATDISNHLKGSKPVVLCLTQDSLVFTSNLLLHMLFPLEFSYIGVVKPDDKPAASDSVLQWKFNISQSLADRTVLVVDTLLDESKKLSLAVNYCKQQGAKEVYSAVLINKKSSLKSPTNFVADFIGKEVIEEACLFGYGLDFKKYLRNLAGIYALSDPEIKK